MGTKLKLCADCGQKKFIGQSKSRCKDCRRKDPSKFLNRPPGSAPKYKIKKKARLTVGPFRDWLAHRLPKCAYPLNKTFSTAGLGREQRCYVLNKYGYNDYAAYLRSELWQTIRAKILRDALCCCGCGQRANQVHHKVYSEANLVGASERGLVPINGDCHYNIEFSGKRKVSLGNANSELKCRQSESTTKLKQPTSDEVKLFLSGKSKRLSAERKMVVIEHLRRQQFDAN